MAQPLLTLRDAKVTFGGTPLFEGLGFSIFTGDRICLVGRNGCGKSTLMKLIVGELELDAGERFVQQGLTIGYLPQKVLFEGDATVYDYVLSVLPKDQRDDTQRYRADLVLAPLEMEGSLRMDSLSGGQQRRAALARALIEHPDVLLLDEPTNHLDITAINWLEDFLKGYNGAVLCVSHDRAFLASISTCIFWLERGVLRTHSKGYSDYERWSEEVMEQEMATIHKLGRKLKDEEHWRERGVTARRKRNMRRMAELRTLREKIKRDRSRFTQASGSVRLPPLSDSEQSRLVVDMEDVSFRYPGNPQVMLDGFSTRILRGDRIGLVGKNGSGKSTLLKLVLGKLEADAGKIQRGAKLRFAYFDQNRQQLNPKKTLWETLCPEGGDQVKVGDHWRHVVAYLKDFLFDPDQAQSPTAALSGGEANRLLLAKILAQPSDVLVLDEPTNDLDMDTLDMLQEMLSDYEGTLLVVSHDRDFLDRTVARIIACEGNGVIGEYVGGYEDYLRQRKAPKIVVAAAVKPSAAPEATVSSGSTAPKRKLSYKQQRALEVLPQEIAATQEEMKKLEQEMANPDLYAKNPLRFQTITRQLESLRASLAQKENDWLEAAMAAEELSS